MILLENLQKNKAENQTEFEQTMNSICTKLGINPNWLMMVMWSESRLNAQAVNKQQGDSNDPQVRAKNRAVGLIQFMPNSALALGTTTQKLYAMSATDQLHYVYAYFKPWTGKIHSYFDLYFVTFFPIALGKPDDFILETAKLSAATIAKQNQFFDANKDGKLTVAEIKQRMYESIPKAIVAEVVSEIEKKSLS